MEIKICKICNEEALRLGSHLIKVHNITSEEYFNSYICSVVDRKCKNEKCTKVVTFAGLEAGYRRFCSNSCARVHQHTDAEYAKSNSIRITELNKDPDFKIKHSKMLKDRWSDPEQKLRHSELLSIRNSIPVIKERSSKRMSITMTRLHKDPEHKKLISANMKRNSCELARTGILSKANKLEVKELIFYIVRLDSHLKIGVCLIKDRDLSYFRTRLKRLESLSINSHEIFIGDKVEVANFEKFIKEEFPPSLKTEYFPLDLYEEIKSKIPNTILPYSTQVA